MAPKLLVVLTSHESNPVSNEPTGWYLPEFAHPFHLLQGKVDFVVASPKGGEAPLAPASVKLLEDDEISMRFLNEKEYLWRNTVKLSDALLKSDEFDAVFYVGGYGPMFDLVESPDSIKLIEKFEASKKPIAAICHGPAALLRAKVPSGQALIEGLEVTGLSNAEEDAICGTSSMPFLLESELARLSGNYVKTEPFGEKIAVSKTAGNGTVIITGQNPASAFTVAREILKALGL